mgnify:CR=1 FL=1
MNKESLELSVAEIVSVTGGILAGSLLAILTDKLFVIPGLLVLMPGFLEMRGNIFGSLAARISTGLHLGSIDKNKRFSTPIIQNTIASFILSVLVSLILGIIAYFAISLFFKIDNTSIILVSFLASVISSVILIPITIESTLWLYRHNYDPNNIIGPYVTTLGDVVSIISLLLAVLLI